MKSTIKQSESQMMHCIKYRNFTSFPGVKILRKYTVTSEFPENHSKHCENCTIQQDFHTKKFGEKPVFHALMMSASI